MYGHWYSVSQLRDMYWAVLTSKETDRGIEVGVDLIKRPGLLDVP